MRQADGRWQTLFGASASDYGVVALARDLSGMGVPVTASAISKWMSGVSSHALATR